MRNPVHRPFKGSFFYEWQIGPVVFQVKRRDIEWIDRWRGMRLFHVWLDPHWRRS